MKKIFSLIIIGLMLSTSQVFAQPNMKHATGLHMPMLPVSPPPAPHRISSYSSPSINYGTMNHSYNPYHHHYSHGYIPTRPCPNPSYHKPNISTISTRSIQKRSIPAPRPIVSYYNY